MLKAVIQGLSDAMEPFYKNGSLIDGRYHVEKYLGCGSYGRSYLVLDLEDGGYSVLKTLRLHKRLSKKSRHNFLMEADLLKRLNHPALPRLHGNGNFGKVPYFTMDYINGKTFEQLIFSDGRIYLEKEAFYFAIKLNEVIGYIHSQGLVHRDVRIPNVMVKNGVLKLIDFGLAREYKSQGAIKPHKNPFREISFRSDFYGLGHFLLFLLYSGYEPASSKEKERSWEEELALSPEARTVIRRLLQLDDPYHHWKEVQRELHLIVNKNLKEPLIIY